MSKGAGATFDKYYAQALYNVMHNVIHTTAVPMISIMFFMEREPSAPPEYDVETATSR